MTPPAVRASIAAYLTDALDLHPHLAQLSAEALVDLLDRDGWQVTRTSAARPVAPRAREAPRTHRGLVRLLSRRARTNGDTAR